MWERVVGVGKGSHSLLFHQLLLILLILLLAHALRFGGGLVTIPLVFATPQAPGEVLQLAAHHGLRHEGHGLRLPGHWAPGTTPRAPGTSAPTSALGLTDSSRCGPAPRSLSRLLLALHPRPRPHLANRSSQGVGRGGMHGAEEIGPRALSALPPLPRASFNAKLCPALLTTDEGLWGMGCVDMCPGNLAPYDPQRVAARGKNPALGPTPTSPQPAAAAAA